MKFVNIDNILSTILVILILKFLPYIFQVDFLNPIENTLEDFQISDIVFSKIMDENAIPDTNIVLVNIGLLNRKGIAAQINIINRYSPKVIGIDSFFRELKSDDLDDPLARAFAKTNNLVLVSELYDYNNRWNYWDTIKTSHEKFSRNAKSGYANFIVRDDNYRTVRNFTPKEFVRNRRELSFALQVASIYRPESVDRMMAAPEQTEFIINFRRNTDKYRTLDAFQLFKMRDSLHFLEGKIVLLGFMGPDVISPTNEDMFFTPLNDRYVGKNYPDMYGVVVHANIISMMLENSYLTSVPYSYSQAFTVMVIFFNMCLYSFVRRKFPSLYEPVSLLGTFSQILIILLFLMGLFYYFGVQAQNAGVFFALLLCKQGYELYNDSLKEIAMKRAKRLMPQKFRNSGRMKNFRERLFRKYADK